MLVEAERVVAVEYPLEAEGVEVVLADLDEAGLDLDELDGAAELVEDVLNLGEVLLRVVDEELADRLHVVDRAALGPLDAADEREHLLPALLVVLLGLLVGVVVLAGVRGEAGSAAHGGDVLGRGRNLLDESPYRMHI